MVRPTRSQTKQQSQPQKRPRISDQSSSDSDIENYLKPAHEIDLNSPFFQVTTAEKPFSEIEKSILGGVSTVDDAESSENDEAVMEIQKVNFEQMQEHLRKIEEAKKHVEEYEAKKRVLKKKQQRKKRKTDDVNIAELLSVGEKLTKNDAEIHSEDFTSMSESEREDWEEVKESKQRDIIPKKGVEITVQMPGVIREKKGVDLVAAMKRRLNRIKKENQVFVHKVSVLCWIAHGNLVNRVVNHEKFLGLALSLIPSEQCYPADRTDLGYLEQVLNWFTKAVQLLDKRDDEKGDLEKQLHIDISKKQASNKKIFVLIFICILRALGIQCRLVMSLLVLPLRPASSELCSLSTKKLEEKNVDKKDGEKKPKEAQKTAEKSSSQKASKRSEETKSKSGPKNEAKSRETNKVENKTPQKHKKESEKNKKKVRFAGLNKSQNKTLPESPSSNTKPNLSRIRMSLRKKISQTDGADDSETDQPSTSKAKPNLKKLKQRRTKSVPEYKEIDSEDEFYPRSPFVRKNPPPKVNLSKLKANRSSSASLRKLDVKNDIINLIKGRISEEKQKTKAKLVIAKRGVDTDTPIKKKKHDSDDEFIASLKPKVKKRVQVKEAKDEGQKKKGNDVWVEVFLEAEEKWISVDVIRKQMHCVNEIYVSIIKFCWF